MRPRLHPKVFLAVQVGMPPKKGGNGGAGSGGATVAKRPAGKRGRPAEPELSAAQGPPAGPTSETGLVIKAEWIPAILEGRKTLELRRANRHLPDGQKVWLLQSCTLKLGRSTCWMAVGHVAWGGATKVRTDELSCTFDQHCADEAAIAELFGPE
eukprot:1335731-Alexandrium_andersonii.AAC.1